VKRIREQIRKNPHRSARGIARKMKISDWSVRTILNKKLKMHPYKIQNVHELTPEKKAVRLQRVKALKQRHASGELDNMVFSDEKLFTVQQSVNKQNDRVWAEGRSSIDSDHFRATCTQVPASVMVWAGVTATGRTPLVFVPQGVKINALIYKEKILEGCLKPWADAHFSGRHWQFQQDSAPAHRAKTTQAWLQANVPAFISSAEWPPYSPDLNPLDFSIWSILESKVSASPHVSVDSLKKALVREWARIPQDHIRAATEAFGKRLGLIVKARGGYIER
jgi:inhibitor of nuclear factor kappa-B kinase subunit alpha